MNHRNHSLGFIFGDGPSIDVILESITPDAVIWLGTPRVCRSPHLSVRLGEISKAINFLKMHKITHLSLIGSIKRPSLRQLTLDLKGILWLSKLGKKFFQGDDALLKGIAGLLQEEGFELISPSTWLQQIEKGVLSTCKPANFNDIEWGFKSLEILSPLDVGQALVIESGRIIGIEGVEGTDELILRCKPYIQDQAILVKAAKIGQILTIDQPTIGPLTIQNLREAGFVGIAIQSTQVVEFTTVIDLCNACRIFFYNKG